LNDEDYSDSDIEINDFGKMLINIDNNIDNSITDEMENEIILPRKLIFPIH